MSKTNEHTGDRITNALKGDKEKYREGWKAIFGNKDMNKPHIEYNNLTGHWICHSEDGPWDICIGAGESVVEAYRIWLLKLTGNDVRIDLGGQDSVEIADEVIKVIGRMSGDGNHQS